MAVHEKAFLIVIPIAAEVADMNHRDCERSGSVGTGFFWRRWTLPHGPRL